MNLMISLSFKFYFITLWRDLKQSDLLKQFQFYQISNPLYQVMYARPLFFSLIYFQYLVMFVLQFLHLNKETATKKSCQLSPSSDFNLFFQNFLISFWQIYFLFHQLIDYSFVMNDFNLPIKVRLMDIFLHLPFPFLEQMIFVDPKNH